METFYLRDKNNHPVACVAMGAPIAQMVFAVSTCNSLDKYQKEVGRALAIGRVYISPHMLMRSGITDAKSDILRTIVSSSCFPTRTRRAAALYLKNPPRPKIKKNKAA